MKSATGDIWNIAAETKRDIVVVPTNVGWTKDGKNVMGRGLAREAARRWPLLPHWYGEHCQTVVGNGDTVEPVLLDIGKSGNTNWCRALLLFPVKPLNPEKPYLSWRAEADRETIRAGLVAMRAIPKLPIEWVRAARILVPSLGCGNGGLDEKDIVPLMRALLPEDCYVHVQLPGAPDVD